MVSLRTAITSLSRPRQIALSGSLLTLLAVFLPWYSIGLAELSTEHVYNGFGDQNLIIGLIAFTCAVSATLLNVLPVFGIRVPRFRYSDATILSFLGGEAFLLVLVLTIMHTTSIVRAVNYDLRFGIHLALVGTALIFLGGYLLRIEEKSSSVGRHEPLVRPPRSHPHSNFHSTSSHTSEQTKEDGRMRLDI